MIASFRSIHTAFAFDGPHNLRSQSQPLRQWSHREGATRASTEVSVEVDPILSDALPILEEPAAGGKRHISLSRACRLLGASLALSHGGLLTEPERYVEAHEALLLPQKLTEVVGDTGARYHNPNPRGTVLSPILLPRTPTGTAHAYVVTVHGAGLWIHCVALMQS